MIVLKMVIYGTRWNTLRRGANNIDRNRATDSRIILTRTTYAMDTRSSLYWLRTRF